MSRTIRLRDFQQSDLEELVRSANNPNVSATLMDAFPSPYTEEDGKRFIADSLKKRSESDVYRQVIEYNGKFSGCIGLHPQTDIFRLNCEIAYWVSESNWGKGVGTEAIRLMSDLAFNQFSFTRLFARVFGSNIASQRALEKAGYTLEHSIPKSIIKNTKVEDCLIFSTRK